MLPRSVLLPLHIAIRGVIRLHVALAATVVAFVFVAWLETGAAADTLTGTTPDRMLRFESGTETLDMNGIYRSKPEHESVHGWVSISVKEPKPVRLFFSIDPVEKRFINMQQSWSRHHGPF